MFAAGAVKTGTLRGATTGAFSAALSFGIGNAYLAKEITAAQRALAHAAAGGFTEAINGGKFGHGFVSAGLSTTFEPMIHTGSDIADATLHAVLGGTASEVSGGKFANGALAAVFSFAFNKLAHLTPQDVAKFMQVEFVVDGTQGIALNLLDPSDSNYQVSTTFPAREGFVFINAHGDRLGSNVLVDTRGGQSARYDAATAAVYLIESRLIDGGQHIVVIGCKTASNGLTRALRHELTKRSYLNAIAGTNGDMTYETKTTTTSRGAVTQKIFFTAKDPGSPPWSRFGWTTLGGRRPE